METPEIEFLLYLLTQYLSFASIDPANTTVEELLTNIDINLTPIGGG
jgi:hypothetical protein